MSPSERKIVVIKSDEKAVLMASGVESVVYQVADLAAWKHELDDGNGNVGLIEFKSAMEFKEIRNRLRVAAQISRFNNLQCIQIAITDTELAQFRKELLISGFSGVFCSQAQCDQLRQMILTHFNQVRILDSPLERRIISQLPWQHVLDN